jgi:hypothetical protein
MLDPTSHAKLRTEIRARIEDDRGVLDTLREEIRPLVAESRRIQPRTTTSISLVGTDGGNNKVEFDPFLVQLVRVVDSSNNEYCLEAITPSTSLTPLSQAQFDDAGSPRTALGEMMDLLGVHDLSQLSHMIRRTGEDKPKSPSWVQVYRELVEWAILLSLVRNKSFGTDTLIVYDGLLRSKVFAGDLFKQYLHHLREAIDRHVREARRRIYLVGFAKHSKVLSRYRLAMQLEGVLTTTYPAYVAIPRELEEKAYVWSEYARGDDRELEGGEINRFVGGRMFFVKFGTGKRDPIWPVDIFLPQSEQAQSIFGYLLADSQDGFPIPMYPQCLQKAHENAALVDFDFDVLQDEIVGGIRLLLGSNAETLDVLRLQATDLSERRYS